MEATNWADLPPELLGLVLGCLPSLADCVRLRAVCGSWRSGTSLQQPLPLPLPWLTLQDGSFLNISGGEIHHLPVQDGASCHGSVGHWLFLMRCDGACSLMNPFSKSKATLELPNLVEAWNRQFHHQYSGLDPVFYKAVAPSPLHSSSNPLVVALIIDNHCWATLCTIQPPNAISTFRDNSLLELRDIAFSNGSLYALSMHERLFKLEYSGVNDLGISHTECMIESMAECSRDMHKVPEGVRYMSRQLYLAECGGRLLMVKRWIRHIPRSSKCDDIANTSHTDGFEVFEPDLRVIPGAWRRVNDLGGRALFVGQRCTKSMPAQACIWLQGDCINFMCDYHSLTFTSNPLIDSGMYNMRSRTIVPLLSGTTVAVLPQLPTGQSHPAWFFPF